MQHECITRQKKKRNERRMKSTSIRGMRRKKLSRRRTKPIYED
jgi:hypothetical protein